MTVGILALQGDYYLHSKLLTDNGINYLYIKKPNQLNNVDCLIIPGGESMVILKLLMKYNFLDILKRFSEKKSIFGTCAGAILMSNSTYDNMDVLNYINVSSTRNYWGRQINSFSDKISLSFRSRKFNAHFIRAPKFQCLSDDLEVLSHYNDTPILIRNKHHLIASFHPEMTNDFSIHKFFLGMANV